LLPLHASHGSAMTLPFLSVALLVTAAPGGSTPAAKLNQLGRNALTLLAHVIRERKAVNASVAESVRRARNAGATWDAIVALLGVSRQAASKRYGSDIGPPG
jgi:hypothetical protein